MFLFIFFCLVEKQTVNKTSKPRPEMCKIQTQTFLPHFSFIFHFKEALVKFSSAQTFGHNNLVKTHFCQM